MKIKAYIENCREKAGIKTNKELGTILEIDDRKLNFYEKGERKADEITCFKISDYLGLNASLVIAEINAEWEKDNYKKEYFLKQVKKLSDNKFNVLIVIISIAGLSLIDDKTNDNWLIAVLSCAITSLYYRSKN